ncbi:MAG: hypothetical protein HYR55_10395 [Acidobacteria bacterium]|nr:hypothetical protein [Acidobacteriota bacterium]MBI3658797.1 hypothetical protein [Acidobacteriota bacterium]
MLRKRTRIWVCLSLLLSVLISLCLYWSPAVRSSSSSEISADRQYEAANSYRAEGKNDEAANEYRLFLEIHDERASTDHLHKLMEAGLFLLNHQIHANDQPFLKEIDRRLRNQPSLRASFNVQISLYYEWANQIPRATLYAKGAIPLLAQPDAAGNLAPAYYDAQLRLGRLLETCEDFKAAAEVYLKIATAPEAHAARQKVDGAFRLANLYVRLNRKEEAQQLLATFEDSRGNSAAGLIFYYRLHHYRRRYGQSAEAERCYAKCVELGGRLPELTGIKWDRKSREGYNYRLAFLSHFFLAKLYKERQEFDRAREQFENIIDHTDPQRFPVRWAQAAAALVDLYEEAGWSLAQIGEFIQETEGKLYKRALVEFLHHVAGYYQRQKQNAEVKKYARRYLEASRLIWRGPEPQIVKMNAIAYFRLANVLAAEGERVEAMIYLQKMLSSPCYGPYFFYSQMEAAFQMVDWLKQMGRSSEANQVLEEAARKVEEYLYSKTIHLRPFYAMQQPKFQKIAIDFYYRAALHYDQIGQRKTAERYLQNIIQLKKTQ